MDFDFEDIFKVSGYESAIQFLVEQSAREIKAGVDIKTALIRFHTKATKLNSLNYKDRMIKAKYGKKKGKKKRS